jgi:hypothetical protein
MLRERLPVGVPNDVAAGHWIVRGIGVTSSRARLAVVWPPAYRRDLQRRSLPRIDPASRRAPTRPLDCIRRAPAVCYLHRDVFVKRCTLDWIPVIRHPRRPHCASQFRTDGDSICRVGLQSKTGADDYQRPSAIRFGGLFVQDGSSLGAISDSMQTATNRPPTIASAAMPTTQSVINLTIPRAAPLACGHGGKGYPGPDTHRPGPVKAGGGVGTRGPTRTTRVRCANTSDGRWFRESDLVPGLGAESCWGSTPFRQPIVRASLNEDVRRWLKPTAVWTTYRLATSPGSGTGCPRVTRPAAARSFKPGPVSVSGRRG